MMGKVIDFQSAKNRLRPANKVMRSPSWSIRYMLRKPQPFVRWVKHDEVKK